MMRLLGIMKKCTRLTGAIRSTGIYLSYYYKGGATLSFNLFPFAYIDPQLIHTLVAKRQGPCLPKSRIFCPSSFPPRYPPTDAR